MSAPGKLCVSVIEARNVVADDLAEPDFYVKLRIGSTEVTTDIAQGNVSPKFLKDIRMGVAAPETDILRIELLQVGPRGDLIVGTEDLRVISVANKGTLVHWFQLRAFGQEVTAELCLVLRYLQGAANRPMTPSYAIAAREAKERAMDNPEEKPAMAKALFQDMSLAPGTPPKAKATYSHSQTASPASSVAPSMAPPASPPPPLGPQVNLSPPAALQRMPSRRSTFVAEGTVAAAKKTAPAVAPARKPSAKAKKGRYANKQVPLPLAIASGVVMGALVWLIKQRPVYMDLHDSDLLCSIGTCVNCEERKGCKNKVLKEHSMW